MLKYDSNIFDFIARSHVVNPRAAMVKKSAEEGGHRVLIAYLLESVERLSRVFLGL